MKMFGFVVLLAAAVTAIPVSEEGFESRVLPKLPSRIIGGEDAEIEDFPYQVSLSIPGYGHICGGSIISRNWVVTAAHCMVGSFADQTIVTAGMTSLLEGGSRHSMDRYIVHPEFGVNRYGIMRNDVALIKVKEPFNFDSKHAPIELFNQGEKSTPGFASVVTGWGETGYGLSDILQMVVLPIITKEKCNQAYIRFGGVPAGGICAGFEQGGKDSCAGDSGGPLAINGRLAGIVSWGRGCARPDSPGVYTEVSAYRDWIRKTTGV